MKNLEIIGLDESKVNKVKDALAQLLADYQISLQCIQSMRSYIMRLQLMSMR